LWIVALEIALTTTAGLFVRAKMGFGFSLVVVPLASLVIGFGPAVLFAIILEVVSSLSMAWLLRKSLRLLDAGLLKVGSFIGLFAAWSVSGYVNGAIAAIAGMVVVIVTCLYIVVAGDVRSREAPIGWTLPLLGMLSGLLNYWTSLSGPPVVLAYARSNTDPARIVATLTGYFSLLYTYTFVVEFIAGRYDGFKYWPLAIACSGGTVLLIKAIKWLSDQISVDFHRVAVCVVGVSAAVVLARELLRH
jgi:uncharacterized membrane protein YfcA